MTGGAGRRAKRDNTVGKERVAAPQLTWFRTVREESRMGIGCGSEGSRDPSSINLHHRLPMPPGDP